MSDERTTVLHVIPGLGLGGAESMLVNLTTAPGQQTRPIVADLLSGGENAAKLRAAQVPLFELGAAGAVGFAAAVRRLAHLIRERKPRVIQGWMYYGDLTATLALRLSGRWRQTRLYWGVRCSDMEVSRYGMPLRLSIAACRRLSNAPEAVVANSEAGRQAHRDLGYRPQFFEVIENGVDTEQFRPDREARQAARKVLGISATAKVVILPARVDPMKDHDNFLASLDRLPKVTGLAVGLGTETLPARPNLKALGPRTDMLALYNAADLVVLSSAYGEGFSTVLGEAMACGRPGVVTDVGDAARILAGTGSVVPPRDPAALAAAIEAFFALPASEFSARGESARARMVEDFALERAVRRFESLYINGPLQRDI